MDELISTLIFLLICTSIWAFTLWRKLKRGEKLKSLVSWVVRKDDNIRYNIPLWAHIKDAQLQSEVGDKYRIGWDEEKEHVEKVLSVFQDHLSQSFFRDEISYKKTNELLLSKPSSVYTDFFAFRLFCFLSEHQCDNKIFGRDIYVRQISHQNHGMYGHPLYDAVYEFSDFGRTVQKLYYITFLACKKSDIYKDQIAKWLTPEYFTEDLDSNQIRISQR